MVVGRVRPLSERLLLQAGVRALTTRALDGVRRVLAPVNLEELSGAGDEPRVSRHSAYRLWPQRDEAVLAVARHVLEPDSPARYGASSALDTCQAAIEDHVRCRQPAADLGKDEFREVFRKGLSATFRAELTSDERMVAWLLQIAATTCSPLWNNAPDLDRADADLGRQILKARIRSNDAAIAQWGVLLRGAMARFGRCPRDGYEVSDIVQLMCCMFDGSILRLFVDPDVITLGPLPVVNTKALEQAITRACDAMFELAWLYTQPGLLADPRRPEHPDDPRTQAFDNIVQHATVVYEGLAPGQPVDLHAIADDAGEELKMAKLLFPAAGDLPDSMMRHLVKVNSEPREWRIDDAAPWIESTLRALSDIATSHPAVVTAVVDHHPPSTNHDAGFPGELTQAVAGLLGTSHSLHIDDPAAAARHLVALALQGPSGWWGIIAGLDRAAVRAGQQRVR